MAFYLHSLSKHLKQFGLIICIGLLSMMAFTASAQVNTLNEDFDDVSTLSGAGWNIQNLSNPLGIFSWSQGDTSVFQPYSTTGYVAASYQATDASMGAVISAWLLTPELNLGAGDTLSFWTRNELSTFADRLQILISTNGASTNVGTTESSVGDFTTLITEINAAQTIGTYPNVYTRYQIVIPSGICGTGRIAFRYYIEDVNNGIDNFADYIGIDELRFNHTNSISTPSIAATPPSTVCAGSIDTLVATGLGNIEWFDQAIGGTLLATTASGAPFVTAPLLTTTKFYAQSNVGGCISNRDSVEIVVNPVPDVNTVSNQTLCDGLSTTAISFSGATVGTQFNWTNDTPSIGLAASGTGNIASFTATNTGGAPVTATITVTPTYTNGGVTCTGSSRTFSITVNPKPVASVLTTDALCFAGFSGTATASVSFGTPTYTYLWSNGATTPSISTLNAGTYSVTVTDANGCVALPASGVVGQPTFFNVSAMSTNVSCNGGNDGSASVIVSGATPPYTYSWSSGGNTATESNLSAGSYTVTITDTNGCFIQNTQTITEPPVLVITPTQTNVLCYGGNNGVATATVSGGSGPYNYAWSNGGTSNSISNLTAGTYSVIVTDQKSCTTSQSYTITEPTLPFVSTGSQTDVNCFGGSDGTATILPSGGTGAYTYLWSDGQITATASGLTAGLYTVTATDANGCTTSQNFDIAAPLTALTTASSSTATSCFGGNNGTATVVAADGTPGYTYLWSNGAIAATATNLAAGTYSVTVTDANGCTANDTAIVSSPLELVPTADSTTNVSCNGGNNGTATVVATGGTGTYTYLWSDGQTTATATGLVADSYSVTVTDANGCTAIQIFIITEPTLLNASAVVASNYNGQDISCYATSDGIAVVTASGGTGAFTYLWSDGQSTATASGLAAGTYSVVVTDANGCTVGTSVTITQPDSLSFTPSQTNVNCNAGNNGTATLSVTGGTGSYTYDWAGSPTGDGTATITNLTAGTYSVVVTDANGCTDSTSFAITEPAQLVASPASQTNVDCFGNATGSATVSVTGGTTSYSYFWSNGQTGATANNLLAGNYFVEVQDANGCIDTAFFTITEPTLLVAIAGTQTNVSCFDGSNGAATVNLSGGTTAYSYLWSNGQTDSTATGLIAGTYSVTVTDANGCTASTSFTITEPTLLVASNGGQINQLCFGDSIGSATVNVLGGTPVYTYDWAGTPTGDGTPTITVLTQGTYTVLVTDANGCTAAQSFTITEPTELLLSIASQTNVSCFGGSNGAATVAASGGTVGLAAQTFNGNVTPINDLSTAISTLTVTGLPATPISGADLSVLINLNHTFDFDLEMHLIAPDGTDILLADNLGGGADNYINTVFTSTASTPITAGSAPFTGTFTPQGLAAFNALSTNPNGIWQLVIIDQVGGDAGFLNNFSITIGGATYTYTWSTGGNTETETGLTAGTYTVTVTDANGCTETQTVNITEPTELVSTALQTNVSCNGGSNGTATISVSGGTPSYTYLWSNGQIGATATGLIAGTYNVTATDSNGCTTSQLYTITEPAVLTASTTQTDVLCNGFATGEATVIPNGGTAPYTYLWSTLETTPTISNLVTGAYSVLVTDSNGCTTTTTVTILQPLPFAVTPSQTNVSCFGGSNGSAEVAVSGQTGPYTYSWAPYGGSNALALGLIAGNYTVTITDANLCTTTQSFVITEPTEFDVTPSSTNVTCFGGNDGTASVSVTGGTGAYTYSWAPYGGTASSATGLIAGVYAVTITDANSCEIIEYITIQQPTAISFLTTTSTNVSCNGGSNGSAGVTVSGGTPGYTYSWSPSGGNAATATGLAANTYTLTVTDANGCAAIQTFNITEPAVLTVTASVASNYNGQDISCYGASDGSAIASVSGGTGPYTYLWSDGQTSAVATGFADGTYSVEVEDANGCKNTQSVTLNQPDSLSITPTQTNVSCNGLSDGTATVAISGGAGFYSYLWSNGQTSATSTGLAAGTYSVTVTDVNGCSKTQSFTISEPAVLVASASSQTNVLCFGNATGEATVAVTGGTTSYSYLWSNGQTTATATGLIAGTYTVTVTDANGCTDTESFTITEPTQLVATAAAQTNVDCFGNATGSATVGVTGGTPAYTYLWSNGQTASMATALVAGTYTVEVTDANGCKTTQSFTITQPAQLIASSGGQTNNICFGGTIGTATVNTVGGTGAVTYLWSNGQTAQTATGLAAGTYTVTVTDANGCTDSESFTITEPTQLIASMFQNAVTCNGGNNGTAAVIASGGTLGYTYLWSTGSTNSSIIALISGTYTVVVTDANGCTANGSITVIQPAPFDVTAASTNVTCNGGSNGTATVIVTGATAPYTYLWSDGQTSATATGLVAGPYTVTITDANGCVTLQNYTITEPAPLVITPSQMNVSCNAGSNGLATASVVGGTAPYTYSWSNGASGATSTGLIAGTYTVTVTDLYGCAVTQSYTITEPTQLTASVAQQNVSCFGVADGSLIVTPFGGTGAYTYLWSTGGSTNTESSLLAGTYSVTITDANGCFITETYTITEPAVLTASATQTTIDCQGASNGEATVFAAGGTMAYSYLWSDGQTSSTASGLSAGTYTVDVTDANGCTASASVTITEYPSYAGLSQNDTICDGDFVTFGGSTYTTAGNYQFTFTTVNGCDSVVTLNLVVNPVYAGGTQTVTVCQGGSYTFGNNVYTSAGLYTNTFTTINGCDSTVTLFLFVNPVSASTFTATACDSYTFNGQTYTSTGIYTQVYQNTFSCDSTVTLDLTINNSYVDTVNTQICQGTSVTFGSSTYSATGTYTNIFQSLQGCDSTVTLNLLVNPVYTGGVKNNTICDGDFVSFGGSNYTTAGSYPFTFQTINGCDSTVTLNLTVNPTYAGGVQTNAICQGDDITFGGNTYNATGNYTHVFTTVNGCDSTVTLNLTVNPTYAGGIQNSTICQGDNINFNGILYSTAGTYTETFQTINGCDSVVTMNLTVNPSSFTTITASGCGSYTLNGQTYTATGIYVQPYSNIQNCDSTVTLNLTINPEFTGGVQTSVICQGSGLSFGGTVYTTSGIYTQTFQTVNGCDSTVTLNLTVNPSYTGGVQNTTICDGDVLSFGGTNYTTAGIYSHTFSSANGCDSSVTLVLSVNPSYAGGTQDESICNGGSFTFGGNIYTVAGSYPHTFQTIDGCDSIVTLNLIVNPTYAGGVQNSVICQGDNINFGGTLYTAAGTFTHTFQTINGCDSTVTMNLTVNPTSVTTLTQAACTSYTLNGITYNASGTYVQPFTNIYGCDSTVTLNLTINPAYAAGVLNAAICQGSSYAFGGSVYTATGSYAHTFQTVGGCDSVVTLNLTVNPSYVNGIQNSTICNGDLLAFGGTNYGVAGSYPHTFQTVNGCDSTVTLILSVNPTYAGLVQNNTICQGTAVTFGGTVYNATGSYTHTFSTINGCDSTVTLNLLVNPTYAGGIQNSVICQGSSINFGGTVYTSSTTVTHTFQTVNGCDSTVTMNLTVNPLSTTSLTASACTSYTLNGQTFAASGNYIQHFTNVYGCDSVVTLNLTINPVYAGGVQTNTICSGSGFTFGGTVYTASGSYIHTFQSINGCDSTVTLNLTVKPSYSGGIQNTAICQGQSLLFGGTAYTASGSYTHTFSTISGCDSVVTLVLVVNPTYTGGVQNNTICQGQSVIFDGTAYTTTGSYTHTFQTVNGCDSVVTLNLIVNPTYLGGIQNTEICLGDFVTFGGTVYSTTGSYVHTFQTVNGCDSTVTMNLTVRPTLASTITVTACVSYSFNGQPITASGTYQQFYTNVYGCDSIVTLQATINPAFTGGVQNNSICQGSSFVFGGSVYNATGSYSHTFHTINGCDSVVTLNLTVNPNYSGGIQTANICFGQSVTFGGTVYTASGLFPHTFQTVNGCDSVVTLSLTVYPVFNGGIQNTVICQGQSVLFGGTAYTTTGNYTHTFQTVHGCDSTVTLNLLVNPIYVGTQNSIICQGSSITFGGTAYTVGGSYTHVFQTINGCDSTVTMNLSVNPISATSLTEVACETYTLNGQTYTSSGVYTQLFSNVYGCDSTVTLTLTINQTTSSTITETACFSYTMNGETFTQSGTYIQMFTNNLGCDSTVTLDLTINHVDVGVTQSGNVLTANLAGGSYQWIDCSSGLPVINETDQSFSVKQNGSYAVVVTDGACSDTSDCFTIFNAGINDFSVIDMNVFPNPNEGEFTIQLGAVFSEIQVELYDMNGKLIMRRQWFNTDVMYISEMLASGIYQVRVKAGDINTVKTIIRK